MKKEGNGLADSLETCVSPFVTSPATLQVGFRREEFMTEVSE
ncbi:MAG TPA: hypothetical protein VGH08_11455 [Chthoniobacterales bacterium]